VKKLLVLISLAVLFWGCGRTPMGTWGRSEVGWKFLEWTGKERLIKHLSASPGEGAYFLALQPCSLEREGKTVKLLPGEGVKWAKGMKLRSSPCRAAVIPSGSIIFQGKGGKGNREFVILSEGIYLLGQEDGERFKFSLFPFRGKFPIPPKNIVLAQVLDYRGWEKVREEFSTVTYLGNRRVFQVIPFFPQDFLSFFTGDRRRVEFYTAVMTVPPPLGLIFPAPGFKFKITAIGPGKREVLGEFFQKKGFVLRRYDVPPWATRIEVKREGREFGNLAFVSNPYFYDPSPRAPVVLLVSMDTVRARSLSIFGGKARTPALDSLAKESLVFRRAYTPVPWTYDGHMAALFSKYPWEKPVRALAEVLQARGFYTAAFTGGGLVSPNMGFARGFLLYAVRPYDVFDRRSSQRLFDQARDFIEKNRDKPLFLFLHTYQAHSPYLARGRRFDPMSAVGGIPGVFKPLPDRDREMARSLYESEISIIDRDLLGPLVKFLREEGLWGRSHLVIFADHGEQFYEHGNWEHGYSLYEEEVHVPLVVRSPKFNPGEDSRLISLVSLWEIVVKICGCQGDKTWKPRRDFVLLFTPKSSPPLYFPRKAGIVKGEYKLIHNLSLDRSIFKPVPRLPMAELYRLSRDPGEKKNLYGSSREGISLFRLLSPMEKFYIKGPEYRPSREELRKLRTLGYAK